METKSFRKLGFVLILALFAHVGGNKVFARENITDWYVQNFDSTIVANKDSSLDITERITADCGNLPNKHGIFRILPENINITDGSSVKTPVELISITDFDGHAINYAESRSSAGHTVTWKIGDANKTVSGINNYLIHYKVKNTIRFGNTTFDELYWNLTGNFWDIEIDKFHGKIVFPEEVMDNNSQLDYYSGSLDSKSKDLATFRWSAPNVLEFDSTKTLAVSQGISASVTFPKNIFTPYKPTFWEKYGDYFAFPIPFVVFLICFYLWWKYGKDPHINKTVIAEYEAPGNLSPIELGMLKSNGTFNNKFVTAEIINLATKKLISIKETHSKVLFFDTKDYTLTKNTDTGAENSLNAAQKAISDKIFQDGNEVGLSSLKNNFYKAIKDIQNKSKKLLEDKKLITALGLHYSTAFMVICIILIFMTFFIASASGFFAFSSFISGLIVLIFGFIMPKRTPAGAELNWQIKGFKLFMETVDKDRAKFYEKENIFEKFLPYAIVFGITGLWIKKMKEIYGEDYFTHYTPVWYAGNLTAFDANSFASTIDSLSSSIASSTSAPSGAGGAGGAGGGGGGGGGGGW
jgi:uncharacterized membrane protein YgcG